MAPRRLSDSEKQDLVGRYKAGESTAALAAFFGCSPNTVSRTVRALLPPEAYAALKASRQKHGTTAAAPADEPAASTLSEVHEPPVVVEAEQRPPEKDANEPASELDDAGSLALDDADDFEEEPEEPTPEEEDNAHPSEVFTELVPLAGVGDLSGRSTVAVKPFAEELLPDSAYMLVDKVVELDARPLKDFPDLDALEEVEMERQGICLFTSPRTAKRHCARSQRVIKVPDTGVFGRTSSYLLARGITRLVVDGSVIALDHKAEV